MSEFISSSYADKNAIQSFPHGVILDTQKNVVLVETYHLPCRIDDIPMEMKKIYNYILKYKILTTEYDKDEWLSYVKCAIFLSRLTENNKVFIQFNEYLEKQNRNVSSDVKLLSDHDRDVIVIMKRKVTYRDTDSAMITIPKIPLISFTREHDFPMIVYHVAAYSLQWRQEYLPPLLQSDPRVQIVDGILQMQLPKIPLQWEINPSIPDKDAQIAIDLKYQEETPKGKIIDLIRFVDNNFGEYNGAQHYNYPREYPTVAPRELSSIMRDDYLKQLAAYYNASPSSGWKDSRRRIVESYLRLATNLQEHAKISKSVEIVNKY